MYFLFLITLALIASLFESLSAEISPGYCLYSIVFKTLSSSYSVEARAQIYDPDGNPKSGPNSEFSEFFQVINGQESKFINIPIQWSEYILLNSVVPLGTVHHSVQIEVYSELNGLGEIIHASASLH